MMLQQNIVIAQCNFFVSVVVFNMNLFKTHCVLIKSFSLKLNVCIPLCLLDPEGVSLQEKIQS